MGLTDLINEPHKTLKSILFIISIFLLFKVIVYLFDEVDGVGDGYINIGSCPNIPVIEQVYSFALSIVSLKCDHKEKGYTYEDIKKLLENYTIEDALKSKVFRVEVPFVSYFENVEGLNNAIIGLKGENVYALSNNQTIITVYNNFPYFIIQDYILFKVKRKHPIYQLYFVNDLKTGTTSLLIYDKEGWSKKINGTVDLNGFDPTDVIAYKILPKIEGDKEEFNERLPFIEDLKTYNLDANKIIKDTFDYISYNALKVNMTEPQGEYFNISSSKNGKLTEPTGDASKALDQLTEILGIDHLEFVRDSEENYKTLASRGPDYIFFQIRLIDKKTNKLIYPSYLKMYAIVVVTFRKDENSFKLMTLTEEYDIGTLYPLYNGFLLKKDQKLTLNVPFPLRELKKDVYYGLKKLPPDYEGYKIEEVTVKFETFIYPYNTKAFDYVLQVRDTGEGFKMDYIKNRTFDITKEDLLDIIEGKERIRDKVKTYALCDYYNSHLNLLNYVLPPYMVAQGVCNTLKKKTGGDKAEYFLEAISYYPYSELTYYR